MKKLFVIILSIIFVLPTAIADTLIDWAKYTNDEIETIINEAYEELDKRTSGDYGEPLIEGQDNALSVDQALMSILQEDISISDYTTIDKVTINANFGTVDESDFIALVYLTYTSNYGAYNDGSFLISLSGDIGKIVEENCPEVNELTIFWDLPNYNSSAKASFILEDGRMSFQSMMWPKVLSEARR